jgi:hypothetical protein
MLSGNRYIIFTLTEFLGGLLLFILGVLTFLSSFTMKCSEAEVITVQMVCLIMIYIGVLKLAPYADEFTMWAYNTGSQHIYEWQTNRKKDKK